MFDSARHLGRLHWQSLCFGILLSASVLPSARAHANELDLSGSGLPFGRPVTLFIDDPALPPHGTLQVALALDYAHELLDRAIACDAGSSLAGCARDQRGLDLVADLGRSEALLSVSLFDAFELGVALPVVLSRAAAGVDDPLALHVGLGDVRAGVGIPLSISGTTHVAARFEASLPTASAHSWSGAGAWAFTPALVVTQQVARTVLAAKLGYQLRQRQVVYDVEQDDQFVLQLGAALATSRAFSITTDASARIGVGGLRLSRRELLVEVEVGARLSPARALSVELAVGTNALPLEAAGFAPALRALVLVRGAFGGASGCAARTCSAAPERPAADSDADGLPDEGDVCRNDPEDHDGFADDDGCPDPDNDADGLLDAEDMCPDRSEDRDGFQDQDGCPEPDDDEDGVADGADRCRRDPEDRDGFEDRDGCPEPGPGRPVVTVSGSRILLSDNIYFDGESDVIGAPSVPVLDELARTLIKLGPRKRVRVEGHTDDAGNPDHNVDLSYRRAKAVVEYLKARDVPAQQLEYAGYGGTRPLADNRSAEGRALNRRVQFTLIGTPP